MDTIPVTLKKLIFSAALFTFAASILSGAPSAESDSSAPESAERLPSVRWSADAHNAGEIIGNKLSNINVWTLDSLTPPTEDEGADLSEFVDYIQFMQATGSSATRDLFIHPDDRSTLDDYNFEPLYKACDTALALGAKPHLKFSVPSKYSSNPQDGDFRTNVYPPDDMDVYARFVAALARGLVERFGREEVLGWRFGVLTEFENPGWFKARSGDPDESREAYFKLYDYTVETLIENIGPEVFVGAHAMACSEGLWDERDLLNHCASGTNYKTGKKGTRICFLAASFYDVRPGEPNKVSFPETIGRLRARAEEVGLKDLIYGVDEGRILFGVHRGTQADHLVWRTVGRTYQAAYDARLLKLMVEHDINYFSAWSYSSGNAYHGYPTVGYYVARNFARFRDAKNLPVETAASNLPEGVEAGAVAGFDPDNQTLRVMAYQFKDDYDYAGKVAASFDAVVPEFANRTVEVTETVIDDRTNFFVQWEKDRKELGLGDQFGAWSPDDAGLDSASTVGDPKTVEIYRTKLRGTYRKIANSLKPRVFTIPVDSEGRFRLETELDRQAVVFWTVTPK